MNEKITDEEVEALSLKHASGQFWHADEQRRVLAHITALTAERDEAEVRHAEEIEAWKDASGLEVGGDPDGVTPNGLARFIAGLEHERDALRERVKALEAERNAYRRALDAETSGAQVIRTRHGAEDDETFNQFIDRLAADSRALAAIRQPVREAMDLLGESSDNATKAWRLLNAALGDDARPLAPPEAFTHEKGLDAGVFRAEDEDPPLILPTTDARASSTTSEAFATVRERLGRIVRDVWVEWAREQPSPKSSWLVPWEGLSEPDREVDRRIGERLAREGSSLLERRMGAMERELRMVESDLYNERFATAEGRVKDLLSALTDAPAVFTLEEVKEALGRGSTVDDVVAILTALRRTA